MLAASYHKWRKDKDSGYRVVNSLLFLRDMCISKEPFFESTVVRKLVLHAVLEKKGMHTS